MFRKIDLESFSKHRIYTTLEKSFQTQAEWHTKLTYRYSFSKHRICTTLKKSFQTQA